MFSDFLDDFRGTASMAQTLAGLRTSSFALASTTRINQKILDSRGSTG